MNGKSVELALPRRQCQTMGNRPDVDEVGDWKEKAAVKIQRVTDVVSLCCQKPNGVPTMRNAPGLALRQ